MKRRFWTIAAAFWACAGGVGLAEAACSGSQIIVAAPPASLEGKIRAIWHIEPACDVIETGLLLGTDPAKLTLVGQPIYGYREVYQQEIPIIEDGAYWIVAYARDEEGNVIQSAPQFVIIAIPPPLPTEAQGSHGALPSYAGTDADFLEPAGNPHFSSLKTLSVNSSTLLTFAPTGFPPIELGSAGRIISSTSRHVVLAEQTKPLPIGSRSVAVDTGSLQNALNQLDRHFSSFPRPGLYAVHCGGSTFFGFPFSSCAATFEGLLLSQQFRVEAPLAQGGTIRQEQFAQSSASFFIPRLPIGKRVRLASLFASFSAIGHVQDFPSGLRINDKSPVNTFGLRCFDTGIKELVACTGFAVWDFTVDTRSRAAQGGGELALVPSMPPFRARLPDPFGFRDVTHGEILIRPIFFNYPWQHAGNQGSLALTLEDDCPKKLDLALTPETVRPQIPGEPTRQVTVDARVTTCPPQPGTPQESIVVTFMIDPSEPVQGSADAGGHFHNGNRPRGNFTVSKTGPTEVMCTVSTFDAQGVGTCGEPKVYFPPEISGNIKIVAEAKDFEKAEKKVPVQVPGLIPMPESGLGTWRLTGSKGSHPGNHFGTPENVVRIGAMATDYFELFDESIGVNDISLEKGGLFDIGGNWAPPHHTHRIGKEVDIDRCAQTLVKQAILDEIAAFYSGTLTVERALVPPPCKGPANTPRIHYHFP